MRRLFWIGVGIAITVVVYYKGRKVVQRYLPKSVAQRVATASSSAKEQTQSFLRDFRDEFTQARKAREAELIAALAAKDQPRRTRGRH